MSDNETPKSKVWNVGILSGGGISYWSTKDLEAVKRGTLKPRYRVAMARGGCTKLLKFKIKDASGNIFSVAAKTQREANAVVGEIYGKGMYRVSEALC